MQPCALEALKRKKKFKMSGKVLYRKFFKHLMITCIIIVDIVILLHFNFVVFTVVGDFFPCVCIVVSCYITKQSTVYCSLPWHVEGRRIIAAMMNKADYIGYRTWDDAYCSMLG